MTQPVVNCQPLRALRAPSFSHKRAADVTPQNGFMSLSGPRHRRSIAAAVAAGALLGSAGLSAALGLATPTDDPHSKLVGIEV